MYFVEIKDRPSNLLGWSSFITRVQRRVWKASPCVSFGRYGKLGMTFVFRDEGLSLQKVKSFFFYIFTRRSNCFLWMIL